MDPAARYPPFTCQPAHTHGLLHPGRIGAAGARKGAPPCICTVTFIRKSMAMWPSSYRTGPPNTFYRQRGKMPISAQIRKGGTLLVHFQKISPDFPLLTRKIRVITLIRTQSSPAVSRCNHKALCSHASLHSRFCLWFFQLLPTVFPHFRQS